jgi:hypothetical protein
MHAVQAGGPGLKALTLTKEHLAIHAAERQRISAAGGFVSKDGRLNGRIQVGRCKRLGLFVSVCCHGTRRGRARTGAVDVGGARATHCTPVIPARPMPTPVSLANSCALL